MNERGTTTVAREETPVDDVRRVRRRLSREAGENVHRLIEQSRLAAERFREWLELKPVTPAQGDLTQKTEHPD